MSYIEFIDIVKKFGDNTVLDHVSLSIEEGTLVTLLGPSGCGKSTLLRCLAGLEKVTAGTIMLDGEDITNRPVSARGVGMVFQQYSLFPNMNVEQNIAFGLRMQHCPQAEIDAEVKKAVALVELQGKEKAYPNTLSGGQQQRVALARSIVTKPKVMLLDEPLSAIDAKLRKSLQIRIREICRQLHLTTIFVTHDQDEAMVMSDVIDLFHGGRVEQSGTPLEVYTAPKTEFAAGFIGSYNQIPLPQFASIIGNDMGGADAIVAIRPETIALSRERTQQNDSYDFQGTVIESTLRGNVIRYSLQVQDAVIRVDVLFRSFTRFDDHEHLWLTVPKRDCLMIEA